MYIPVVILIRRLKEGLLKTRMFGCRELLDNGYGSYTDGVSLFPIRAKIQGNAVRMKMGTGERHDKNWGNGRSS
jgi:hypothetical protein